MRTLTLLSSDNYGNFSIEKCKNGEVVIWWDFYDEQDGILLEPSSKIEECEIQDFRDLPKDGVFETVQEAKKYIENKFGKVK